MHVVTTSRGISQECRRVDIRAGKQPTNASVGAV
jgi:hypothetical protein